MIKKWLAIGRVGSETKPGGGPRVCVGEVVLLVVCCVLTLNVFRWCLRGGGGGGGGGGGS